MKRLLFEKRVQLYAIFGVQDFPSVPQGSPTLFIVNHESDLQKRLVKLLRQSNTSSETTTFWEKCITVSYFWGSGWKVQGFKCCAVQIRGLNHPSGLRDVREPGEPKYRPESYLGSFPGIMISGPPNEPNPRSQILLTSWICLPRPQNHQKHKQKR